MSANSSAHADIPPPPSATTTAAREKKKKEVPRILFIGTDVHGNPKYSVMRGANFSGDPAWNRSWEKSWGVGKKRAAG